MSESFAKKEKTKQRAKDKQAKAEKMQHRKSQNTKGKSLEDMMAYLDENGNITSTPPDGRKRKEISLEDIQLGAARVIPEEVSRSGSVTFYNDAKGYGFITDEKSQESIFFHSSTLSVPIKERDKVTFEKERGPKGFNAVNIIKTSK